MEHRRATSGAVANYLNKLITNPSYNKLAKDFQSFLRRLPKGELALKLAHKAEEGFKGAINDDDHSALRQTGSGIDAVTAAADSAASEFSSKKCSGLRYARPD